MQGAIDTAWILRKTDLLKLEADELCSLAAQVYKDEVTRARNLSSIHKNVQLMEEATATANLAYEQLSADITVSTLKQAQMIVSKEISELKKSQGNLTKALMRKRTIIKEILEKEKQAQVALPPTTLTSGEVEDIVQDIKDSKMFTAINSSPTESRYSDEYPPPPKRPALLLDDTLD